MFGKLFQLDYPVWESEEESWSRFEEIYTLSAELAGNRQAVPQRGSSLGECWKDIALLWGCDPMACGDVDPFFEALYHICFRRFSDRVHNPLLMRLLLLIEDELLTFSFAFKAWLQIDLLREAYDEITAPYCENKTFNKQYDGEMYMYLMYRVVKLVMLKNMKRDEWLRLFPMGDNLYPFRSHEVYWNVDAYEKAVKFLIPAANSWYEEWSDRAVMVDCINRLYGVDFSDDIKGLYSLIYAVEHRNAIIHCSHELYQMKQFTPALGAGIWGNRYEYMLQKCFMDIYRRYKISKKKTKRSKYTSEKLVNSWLYQWIDQKRLANMLDPEFDGKIRSALLSIAMNI